MIEERLRVLLVDDEKSLREPLKRHLENFGFHVDAVASGEQAVRLVEKNQGQYDVALFDEMLLGELDGIETMQQVKDRYPDIEAVIFTGWGMHRALEALRAGAYRYLAKPLNLDELGMTIWMAAEHRRLKQQLETAKQEKEWLQTFLEIGRATTSVLELDEVLERVHEQVGRLLDASCLDVILYDELSQTLRFELGYDRGEKKAKWQRPFTRGQGLADWVIEHCQPLLIKDYPNEEPPVVPYQRGDITHSWLGVPLVARDRVIGAITVQSYKPYQFDETHQQILTAVASQVANAIENARLFSELTEAKEWREALIENAFDTVIAIDQNKRISVFNQRAEEMFGWVIEEMIGQTVARLHMDVDKAKEIFDVVNREGAVSGWEVELRHRDGTRIPALLSTTLIQDGDGRLIGQAGFMRDLRQVNLLEERLRALIQVSQAITGTLELDNVLDLIVESTVAAFPASQSATIHLYDERDEILPVRATTRCYSAEALEALSLSVGEGISGWVFQNQQPLVVDDTRQDPRYKWIDHPEVEVHRSMICVPLRVREQVIGTLSLNNSDTTGAFQADDLGLLPTFANQAAIAICNARLYQETDRRQQLLTALDEASRHIRAVEETSKLLHQIVRRAARLVDCSAGGLFTNHPHLGELELSVTYELPAELIGSRLSHAEGLAGRVARTGKPEIIHEYFNWPDCEAIFQPYNFTSAAAVPLVQAGVVEAVLLVADSTGPGRLIQTDLEILERFAVQAAVALQTSRLMSQEQRMLSQLGILHQISDYIQAAGDLDKILHVVLTGVTAGYGLGFNRAAFLLLDERREYLIGRMGIGQFEEPEARQDWAQHHQRELEDFRRYLELLDQNELPLTPVGNRIREIRLSVTPTASDPFSQAMRERRCILVTQSELNKLPKDFVKSFEPASPLVVAPLLARGQAIGLLVADNKFTESPITPEDEESLLTFVNTAAVAIDNADLIARNKSRLRKLEMLSQASNEMMSNLHSLDLNDRLNLIVRHAAKILDAEACSILLVKGPGFLTKEACYGHLESDFQRGREFAIISGRKTGLTGHIAYTGELFNAHGDDLVGHWAVAGKEPAHISSGKCYSLLAIPLKKRLDNRERLVGLLEVENKKDKDGQPKGCLGFTEEDEWILSTLAETVVICLENAELYDKTSERLEEKVFSLRAIQETSAAISAELDLDELLKLITKKAATVFAAPAASLMLWDDAEENLVVRAKHGLTDEYTQQCIPKERVDATIASIGGLHPIAIVDLRSRPFGRLDLIEAENLYSVLSTPLVVSSRLTGVLNIYSKNEPRQFTSDEIEVAEVFATQAATAIENAHLYQSEQQRVKELSGLHTISQSIRLLTDIQEVYQQVNESMAMLIGVQMCAILLYDEAEKALVCQLPMYGVPDKIGRRYRIPVGRGKPASIWKMEDYLILNDVEGYPLVAELGLRELAEESGLRDTLLVKLTVGNRNIGVVQASNKLNGTAFNEDDARLLRIFAGQAAAVIENARLYEELKRTKGLVGARTALAWMGMISSAWRHAIANYATTIQDFVELARRDIAAGTPAAEIRKRLERIDHIADKIRDAPITAPLQAEEGVRSVAINQLLRERAKQLWAREPYRSIKVSLELKLDESSTVRASPDWLRRAFDIVVDNAVAAMTDSATQQLIITTQLANGGVELAITDTGQGIPDQVLQRLFQAPIPKHKGAKGLGVGLLMAHTIVQTYGGDIRVGWTFPSGTAMVIWLPIES